jgi:hypothetical protein
MELALHWPATPPFEPVALKAWRLAQTSGAKGLPDFGASIGTLGGSPGATFTPWRMATVILRSESGFGSGTLISADGWIVSNYRVVAEAAQRAAVAGKSATVEVITAQLVEGRLTRHDRSLKAALYRANPRLDLALLRLEALPEGANEMPHFPLGDPAQVGEECFVVGSRSEGPAWWVGSGNVTQELEYPQDVMQFLADVASDPAALERTRATVVVSDVLVAAGDAGGPLLNPKGELIGLTFAPAANLRAAPGGWHIALKHLREFVRERPARPEGVPLDAWTAGLPESTLLEPEMADGDGDGRIDSLRYRHASPASEQAGATSPQPVAVVLFVDLQQRTGRAVDPLERVPTGLWGMEDQGRFRFDLFLLTRADGVTAVGYTKAQGVVDDIRVGRAGDSKAKVLWLRGPNRQWQAHAPAADTPLLDPTRVGENNMRRLQAITRGFLAAPTPGAGPAKAQP